MDLALTLTAIAAISTLTALGVLVLPWTEAEIGRTVRAARAVPVAAGELQRAVESVVPEAGLGEGSWGSAEAVRA